MKHRSPLDEEYAGLVASGRIAVLESAQPAWHGLPMDVVSLHGPGEQGPVHADTASVAVCLQGGLGHSDVRIGANTYRLPFSRGVTWLNAQGVEVTRWQWEGSAPEIVAVHIPLNALSELNHGEAEPLHLRTQLPLLDDTLLALICAMREELGRGGSSGRMYAQGLSIALVGYLRNRYGAPPPTRRTPGRLAQCEVSQIADYVAQHLAHDIGVDDLAALCGLSNSQFSRLFKETLGLSPFQYLKQMRIKRATELLLGTTPLAHIAHEVGYSSQSHFTQVFREVTGVTPAVARWQR